MTELSSQAYDRVVGDSAGRDHLHFPPWTRVLVISAETGSEAEPGEVGLLRVFDLANVFSVMAIETEDLAMHDSTGVRLIGRNPGAEPRGCSLQSAPLPRAASAAMSR